jgi:prepilin-type N-terminal cleavage/methylation domain-containing protein
MLTRDRRPAFTLIELLVVVSIIAVLSAITVAAVFGVRRSMQTQNCEATIGKLDQKLGNRVKELRDRIQDETKKGSGSQEYSAALSVAGTPEGAKSLMLYARLKQQLPMTYTEGNTAFTIGGYTYTPSLAFREFSALPSTASVEESAVCLHAAINAMGQMDGLEQQVGTGPLTGQKVFVDGFGTPIGFVRIAYDGHAGEMNHPTIAVRPGQDPFDPDNKLSSLFTSNTALWNTMLGPQLSAATAGPYTYATPYRANAAQNNRFHAIVLISAGPNRTFVSPTEPTLYDGDNILSYRLRREGASGN